MTNEGATRHFEPEPPCAAKARHFVVGQLDSWGLHRFADDAALCTAELATNAILHCRRPFTVGVRPISAGVRIDVQDDRPDRLPVRVPAGLEPLASGTTGRGLRLVSAVCSRWGYIATALAKTVWAEMGEENAAGEKEPLVEVAARPPDPTARPVRLVDLPVKAAIASGVQIDDLVRELQLAPTHEGADERAHLYRLLERSATPRLVGRHEAFRAAGAGQDRYTLELTVSADELAAVGELVAFLEHLARTAHLAAVKVPADVEAMRAWLPGEVAAQYAGHQPSPYRGTDRG